MEKIEKLKKLREDTNMSISECNKALLASNYDLESAYMILKKKMENISEKKSNRVTKSGIFGTYSHRGGALLGIVELLSETDFVSKTQEFKELAQDLAAQVLFSADIKYVSENNIPEFEKEFYTEEVLDKIIFMRQFFYKDNSLTVKTLLNEYSAKFGEKLEIANFYKFEIK